ncbi:MAG: SPOR domain-containing protein [Trueperaceae bacterium]|nr:SPOR domain-containing protein [Trueperaceae bacterium]
MRFKPHPLKLFLLSAALMLMATGLAISYTVQVIAVSSEPSALKLMTELADQGYPAYLIRVPTPEGPVFRIRVGSFADRNAASKFAEAMSDVLDSAPTPALADGIPSSLAPLEAELVDSISSSEKLEVLPWQGEVAFRSQLKNGLEQAHYRIVDLLEFDAWRAIPQSDGSILRVYSHYLWDEDWTIRTDSERANTRLEKLQAISTNLGLSVTQLEGFEFTPANSRPYLVLVEKFNPNTQETSLLKALGQPDSPSSNLGPELVWLDQKEISFRPITPQFEPTPSTQGEGIFESPDGYRVRADGLFIQVTTSDPAKSWRAAAGRPLWLRENWLIASYNQELLLYKFKKP